VNLGSTYPPTLKYVFWDSTAELRYLVLPERPRRHAQLNEEQLAALVTRDSMVGVGKVAPPQAGVSA